MNKKEHDKKIKELEERSYEGMFQYPDIIEELDKLLDEDPNDIEALNFKADMLHQLGHKEEASLISAKVLSLNFKDKEAMQALLDVESEGIKLPIPVAIGVILVFVLINILFFIFTNNIQGPNKTYNDAFKLLSFSFVACPVVIVVLNWLFALKRCNQAIPGYAKQYFKNVSDDIIPALAFIVSVIIGFVVASLIKEPYAGTLGVISGIVVYSIWAYFAITAEGRAKKKKKNIKKH